MRSNVTTTVSVQYRHRDGWHIFTSQDIPGLYIASQNAKAAYEDVPVAVKRLLELDFKCSCEVVRTEPFDTFAQTVLGRVPEGDGPLLRDEAFFVRGCVDDRTGGSVQG
jgi:hypothetical protein